MDFQHFSFRFALAIFVREGTKSAKVKAASRLAAAVLQFSAQPQGGWSLEAALSGRKHINRSLRILGEKNWKQGGEGALLIMSRFRFSLAKLLFLIMTSVMSYYALEVWEGTDTG